jgi:hypothetical protein
VTGQAARLIDPSSLVAFATVLEIVTIQTTDSMTGTSISTPTTVASAAPDFEAEQADGGGDGQFEEVAGADQRRGPGDAMRSPAAVEQIGEAGVEIDLDQDRHGQQRDDQRLRDDLLALEAEQQHQRRQQRDQRQRLERASKVRSSAASPPAQQHAPPDCATITGTTM